MRGAGATGADPSPAWRVCGPPGGGGCLGPGVAVHLSGAGPESHPPWRTHLLGFWDFLSFTRAQAFLSQPPTRQGPLFCIPSPQIHRGKWVGGVALSHLVRGTLTLPQLAHSRTLDLSRALLINAMKGLWGQLRQRVSECLSGGCVHLGEVRFSEALGGTPTQSRTRPREPGSLLRESPSWESARPVPLRAPVGSPDSRLQAVPAPAARLSPSPRPPPHTATGCLQRGPGPSDTGCCSRVAPGPVCRGPARVAMGTAPRSAEPGVDVGASPGASAPSCSLCLVFCVKLPSSVRACFIPTLSTVDRCVNSCI